MTDPFAHGTPVGDSHTWVQPPSGVCPGCECCTAHLCWLAAASGEPCHWIGSPSAALVDCQCSARAEVARQLSRAMAVDPSNPAAGPMCEQDRQDRYNARNGALIGAAHAARRAGIPSGVQQLDPGVYREYATVLMLVLPDAGQVTWHLPTGTYHLDGAPEAWDGHDHAEKYRRVLAWLATQPGSDPAAVRRAALVRVLLEAARRCAGNDRVSIRDLLIEAQGGIRAHQHNVAGLAHNAARNAGARDSWPAHAVADTLREIAARLLAGEDVDTDWRAPW